MGFIMIVLKLLGAFSWSIGKQILSLDFGKRTCWELKDGNEIICEF
jgi:hypothetical protein